ncbi:MAG: TonB-dependent receptor [Bacteroidota bacterium]
MRNSLLIIILLFSKLCLAQEITINGQVVEQNENQPIEYATLTVNAVSDSSLITGTVTDLDGKFELSFSPTQDFYVSIQFLGYETYYSKTLDQNISHQLGTITLALNNTTLTSIEVTGRAITSVHKIDKQVFDASQFKNAKGGNATDALRNLPSVSINSFGEISVRGASGFLVMINGKPVQGDPLTILQQLPANAIDDIEVVTAPSAKYDPDGKAGIINIKTRQAITDGQYIIANIMGGLPSIEDYDNQRNATRFGADFTYNYQNDKWSYSLGFDFRRYDISGRREGYVNTYLDEVLTEFPSDGERSFDELNYSARAAVSFSPSSNQIINAGFYAGNRSKDRTADILYLNQQRSFIPSDQFTSPRQYFDLYQQNGTVFTDAPVLNQLTYFNSNLRVRKGDFRIATIDYTNTFKDNSQLSLSALYERTVLGGPTENSNEAFPNTENILQLQFNDNDNPLDGYRFQVDYSRDLGTAKLESGYQYRYLRHPGDFIYLDRDLVNNVWIENPLFTNRIELSRAIHSLYSQISGNQNKFQYIVGLRLENFDREVDIASPDSTFLLNRWNLFPSVNLAYQLGEGLQLKAAYSRRIERTTTFKMTPFPEREHSETLEQGDAELLPEYIDLVEIGVVKSWGDHSIFATAYFRNVDNVINRVNTVFNDTILNRIYTNAGTAQAIGMEIGTTFFPTKKWRVYLGGNIYNYSIEGQLFGDEINTSNTIYSINANTTYEFSSTFNAQLAFNYLSERVTAQGRDSEFYNPALTLTKTFWDKKVSVALQWINIDMGLWNANEQRITTERSNFFTTTNYVYEVDIIQLNLTYQLNQPLKKVKVPESEFGKKEF